MYVLINESLRNDEPYFSFTHTDLHIYCPFQNYNFILYLLINVKRTRYR